MGHIKNILSDGLGAWEHHGNKYRYFQKDHGEDLINVSKEAYRGRPNSFCVKRANYLNKHYPDVHTILVTVADYRGNVLDEVFVQYYFEQGKRQLKVQKHGNRTRDDRPYIRTQESTKLAIRGSLKDNLKPKEHYHTVLEGMGGLENISVPGQAQRDRRQIKNFRSQEKAAADRSVNKDELAVLVDMFALQEEEGSIFLHDVTTNPEISVFIATRDQLLDMERLCTDSGHFSIVGVDPTFNVGNFYVTMTSYRHLKLETTHGIHPVILGPTLIHQRKLFRSYFELPAKMIKYNPNLRHILAFGTDGEKSLADAFKHFLPSAKHLLCDIHMKDNCKRKLAELNITPIQSSQFIADIFGQVHGTKKQKGPIDATTGEEFDTKLQTFQDIWTKRHINGSHFFAYFRKEKAPMIRTQTADIRCTAGLGYPPISYNQNANEAINSAFKRGMTRKLSLPQTVKSLQLFLKQQHDQITLSLINCGEYRVLERYKHLLADERKFYRMSEQGRERVRKRFLCESVKRDKDAQLLNSSQQVGVNESQIPAVMNSGTSCVFTVPCTQELHPTTAGDCSMNGGGVFAYSLC